MPTTYCTYTKPDGAPCAAQPLPGSDFCLFHDPAYADALAEARSKGGSTPRRAPPPRAAPLAAPSTAPPTAPHPIAPHPPRPLPHLAHPPPKPAGTPKAPPLPPADPRGPANTDDHPLRVYPPLSPGPAAF